MKIKSGYILRKVADSNVVVAVGARTKEFSGVINLTETSAFVWKMLEKGADKQEIITAILTEYEVDRTTAEKDLDEFLQKITEAGLVE